MKIPPQPGFPASNLKKSRECHRPALMTDLYEFTMAAAYFQRQVDCRATFELFIRSLPSERSYLVAAGVESALNYLENLRFEADEVEFLRALPSLRTISAEFFDYLGGFRFTGDVKAVEEGTLVFGEEPIFQVTAPVIEAQIIETFLLSVINFETLIASKAARIVKAARGRTVLEFGSRRAHGPEAGVRAARAAYLGGCSATSNVLAGMIHGVPLAGTAAHSWTQVFPTERESFEALAETYPGSAVLLIDTYDPQAAAELVAALKQPVAGVRIDSGELAGISRRVREILDRTGAKAARIVASGDLNEYKIAELVARDAPIDSFGVGTELSTSHDVPTLQAVYKLVETDCRGRIDFKAKLSPDKVSWPGKKQVFRFSENGMMDHDVIGREGESHSGSQELLRPAIQNGRRVSQSRGLEDMRATVAENLSMLPEEYHKLRNAPQYLVRKSGALQELLENVRMQVASAREE